MSLKWPTPIDHAYILCSEKYEPLRYKTLKESLNNMNIDPTCYSFVYFKHGSELTPEEAFKAYNPWKERISVPHEKKNYNHFNLKLSEISLGINWANNAASAVKDGHKVVLMLESDAIFVSDFLSKLDDAMAQLSGKEWDFLSIGDGVGLRPPRLATDTTLKWFPAPIYYHTRTTDAMIFRVDMLKKILSTYFPFQEIIDWELNYQLTRHKSHSFWLDPILVKNGSCFEQVSTSL
jgi:hypothetical protein